MPSIQQMMTIVTDPLGAPIRPERKQSDPAETWERVRDPETGKPTLFERNGHGRLRTIDMAPTEPKTPIPKRPAHPVEPQDEMNRFPIGSRWIYEPPHASPSKGLEVVVDRLIPGDFDFVRTIRNGLHYEMRKAWLKPIEPIKPAEPRPLRLGDKVRIGAVDLKIHPHVDAMTRFSGQTGVVAQLAPNHPETVLVAVESEAGRLPRAWWFHVSALERVE